MGWKDCVLIWLVGSVCTFVRRIFVVIFPVFFYISHRIWTVFVKDARKQYKKMLLYHKILKEKLQRRTYLFFLQFCWLAFLLFFKVQSHPSAFSCSFNILLVHYHENVYLQLFYHCSVQNFSNNFIAFYLTIVYFYRDFDTRCLTPSFFNKLQ